MREILFRGKDIATGEWKYGFVYDSKFGCFILVVNTKYAETATSSWTNPDETFRAEKVKKETVGQYTGIDDFKKAKLFDNDIIKHPNGDTGVIYREASGKWLVDYGENNGSGSLILQAGEKGQAVKVGNIHDNPASCWKK